MNIRPTFCRLCLAFLLFLPVAAALPARAAEGPFEVVEGTASIAWGDPLPGSGVAGAIRLTVHLDGGGERSWVLPPGSPAFDFNPAALQGRRVRVMADPARGPWAEPLGVLALAPLQSGAPAVTGSQPWISLMCKFSNLATEPRDIAFFTGMFANTPGRLDHYWRETSYGNIDVVGSTAFGWVVLPSPQTTYVPTPGTGCLDANPGNDANLPLLFTDCTAAADPFVDFTPGGGNGYAGINLMFNGDLDGCAWGGSRNATLDGVTKSWRTTWEPPWGYADVAVMAHEMGHGFGLPHSNNWDGDTSPYDHNWDVMSGATLNVTTIAPYGRQGKHTIAYHKNLLGWFTPAEVLLASAPGVYSVEVADVALPPPVDGYRMIRIPIPASSRYWTVEVRDQTGAYDANLPGRAVLIHEIDTGRQETAWCFDPAVPPGNFTNTESVMFKVGETFEAPSGTISVRVTAATADGFAVTVYSGVVPDELFSDGFESGTTGAWSDSVG